MNLYIMALATVIILSSIGCRTDLGNSGNSSRNNTPLCAKIISRHWILTPSYHCQNISRQFGGGIILYFYSSNSHSQTGMTSIFLSSSKTISSFSSLVMINILFKGCFSCNSFNPFTSLSITLDSRNE